MKLTPNSYKHCDLVTIEGRVDSSTSPQLADALNSIIDSGRFRIVLDFGAVDFMSSAGLRVLINTQKTCKRYNRGEVALAAVPSNIHAALDLAGFTMLFKFYDNVLDAVASF